MKKQDAINKLENQTYDHYTELEAIPLNCTYQVLFKFSMFNGIVGETIETYEAYLIGIDNKNQTVHELNFEDLERLYKQVKGKDRRISYWQWMKHFSPKAEKERHNNQLESALSRVR